MGIKLISALVERVRVTFGPSPEEQRLIRVLERKVLGCKDTAERLIRHEQNRRPGLGRQAAIEAAIDRWNWDSCR